MGYGHSGEAKPTFQRKFKRCLMLMKRHCYYERKWCNGKMFLSPLKAAWPRFSVLFDVTIHANRSKTCSLLLIKQQHHSNKKELKSDIYKTTFFALIWVFWATVRQNMQESAPLIKLLLAANKQMCSAKYRTNPMPCTSGLQTEKNHYFTKGLLFFFLAKDSPEILC